MLTTVRLFIKPRSIINGYYQSLHQDKSKKQKPKTSKNDSKPNKAYFDYFDEEIISLFRRLNPELFKKKYMPDYLYLAGSGL